MSLSSAGAAPDGRPAARFTKLRALGRGPTVGRGTAGQPGTPQPAGRRHGSA